MTRQAKTIDVGRVYDLAIFPVMLDDNTGAKALYRYHAAATDMP